MANELYLFNQDERKKAGEIINTLETLLQSAGYSLLDKKKLPPTEEEVIALFSSADISEKSRTDLTEGFSFLSKKLESNFFYITYHFEEIELEPTEEDRKRFSEDFLKEAKKYLHAVEWQYFTNDSSRIAGVRVAEPIKEDNPAFSLLKWESFKQMNVEEETLQQIRKALNLEDHFFIYAPDYLNYGLASSLLTLFVSTRKEEEDGLPELSLKRNSSLSFPLDKWSNEFWATKEEDYGQTIGVDFTAKNTKKGNKQRLIGSYSIIMDDEELKKAGITLSKKLTAFDERVYCAIGSSEDEYTSINKIHYDMGNTTKPNDKQKARIKKSLDKMRKTDITFENEAEAKKYNYDNFKYNGYLLPIEYIEAISNGKTIADAIHIIKELPLFQFARQRGQITAVPVKLLQSPINKTDKNLAIENFLIKEIRRKNNRNKFSYETLFKNAEITDKDEKTRTKTTVITLMDFYKDNGFIKSYTKTKDGIIYET